MHFVLHKKTKILATIGPASCSEEILRKLMTSGLSAARLGFSHGTYEDHEKNFLLIRKLEKELDMNIPIIQDLQGPKIRLGILKNPIELTKGEKITLCLGDLQKDNNIPVQFNIFPYITKGEVVYINDGTVRLIVEESGKSQAICTVEIGGTISSNKGVNLPQIKLQDDILVKKDLEDLAFAKEHNLDFDYIAISFVQTGDDIRYVRKLLKDSQTKIIAKIETATAIKNLESIIQESDAVMIARGDLAVEIGQEEVPLIQKRIIKLAHKHNTPIIVATQMLESMIKNTEPTRAEVNDVASAVLDQVDAVMLSAETAVGQYPVRAVSMMNRIIERVGKYMEENKNEFFVQNKENNQQQVDAIAESASMLASHVEAKMIFVRTETGKTAYKLSGHRPSVPIIAIANNRKVCRQLSLLWGTTAFQTATTKQDESDIYKAVIACFHDRQILKKDDNIVLVTGTLPGKAGHTNVINITRVGEESFL